MAELIPMAVERLLGRALRELRVRDAIFDLPRSKWWVGRAGLDPSVTFLGRPAATCVGPAAGPQSQMVQNIVLAWLAGARIFELKTVQILDRLDIPRPCIDARNVGYNVEWSQELTLEESLSEYVAAWVVLHVLRALDPAGRRDVVASDPFVFDMSVGYDLKGIRSDRVRRWIDGMRDAGDAIAAVRGALPAEVQAHRDVPIPSEISNSITLSTFHGCPPDEIERIGEHILDDLEMDLIVKLNPTLLGYERVAELLRGQLGYEHIHPVPGAFDEDLQWADALPLIQRLTALAARRGRRFGIKLTNTLVVENRGAFFSDERMYLSGQPLHVLAMNLLWALRQEDVVGDHLPVSFSAGIDQKNFPDAVALGLTPVTTCTDLLRPGGYARLAKYGARLEERMVAAGASDIPGWIRAAAGHSEETTARAAWLNTRDYVATLADDPRYHAKKNSGAPRKVGSQLTLFDCINCDKCVPVCPNDANFNYTTDPEERTYRDLLVQPDATVAADGPERTFRVQAAAQLGCYTDFCNECGNCDIFCPEDGGPYLEKPRFFGSLETFRRFATLDGYVLERLSDGGDRLHGRMRGAEVSLHVEGDGATVEDGVVALPLDLASGAVGAPRVVSSPEAPHLVALERAFALRALYRGITRPATFTWATA